MTTLGRPIAQIAIAQSDASEGLVQTVIALCTDQTLWALELLGSPPNRWRQLPPIPLPGTDR